MALPQPSDDDLRGLSLYGEGLDDAALAEWFASEAEGYQAIVAGAGKNRTAALTRYHALRHLPQRHYAQALALGPADGGEYRTFAGQVGRFVAIEPGQGFWRARIAGVPAAYRLPTLRGTIDLADASCDLAAGFGVLHHIANVSEVLCELARVLRPGAPLILREPIGSLGDFRQPRPGLTRHERGIPHRLMDRMLQDAGFALHHKALLGFPGLVELALRLGVNNPWDRPAFVRIDALLSRLMRWNVRYRRTTLWRKAAPRMAYWVALRKPLSPGAQTC